MKNSHHSIYHLIFKGQECTVPYVTVKKTTVNYITVTHINIYFAMLDYK